MINLKRNIKDFGLEDRDFENILSTISHYKEVDLALIFGSRAKGTYNSGSDIDIAIKGENINYNIVKDISVQLNEYLPLPYFVDVIDYSHLKKDELIRHIDNFGKVIYKRLEE